MAWAKPTNITSWSFSRWKVYDQCPYKAKLKFIDKLPEPSSPAMERGDAIHKLAQKFLEAPRAGKLPVELHGRAERFKELRASMKKKNAEVQVETTWAYTAGWEQTTWNDWAGCWLRVKIDVAEVTYVNDRTVEIDVDDWKTGKFSPQYGVEDYLMQLELYALGGLMRFKHLPNVEVRPRLQYLDAGLVYPPVGEGTVYTQADREPLRKKWEKRVKPMLADKRFAPKPNRWCSTCHYRKDNGGPCKF